MEFFSDIYIRGKQVADDSSTGGLVSGRSSQQTATPAPAPPAVSEPLAYSGPFSTQIGVQHEFVLIIPQEGVNHDQLKQAISAFNQLNFSSLNLTVSATELDDFRRIIRVEGLGDQDSGMAYLQQIVRDQAVYRPLEEVDYRNFIITPDNLRIFVERKNINSYMDYYRRFYLNQ